MPATYVHSNPSCVDVEEIETRMRTSGHCAFRSPGGLFLGRRGTCASVFSSLSHRVLVRVLESLRGLWAMGNSASQRPEVREDAGRGGSKTCNFSYVRDSR